jgi:hypothetical protein
VPRIELFHNVNRDAGFGLNTVFMRKDPGGYVKEMQAGAHELVRVFECDIPWTNDRASVDPVLNKVWCLFNVGSDELAAQYRARNLRSLSVGDVIFIDGAGYSCESVGWEPVSRMDLNILKADEAERVVRERFDFGPTEELAVTVPLED